MRKNCPDCGVPFDALSWETVCPCCEFAAGTPDRDLPWPPLAAVEISEAHGLDLDFAIFFYIQLLLKEGSKDE